MAISIMDIFKSEDGQRLSHTKIWSNVGNLTATFIIIYMTIQGNLSIDMFVAYMLIVSAHNGYSKFIASKYMKGRIPTPTNEGYGFTEGENINTPNTPNTKSNQSNQDDPFAGGLNHRSKF